MQGSTLSPTALWLCDALEAVNTRGPAATEVLVEVYHEDVIFQDPVQKVHGRQRVLDAVARYARGARRLELHVDRTRVGEAGDCFYLPWTSIFTGRIGPTVYCDGVSQLQLRDGRVIHHRDYFDVLGTALGSVPRAADLYQALLQRFTSPAV